ncbi:hypothetical protein NHX12_009055 [Muraenolepis orangiensis]|uniref:Uncharacterized protein n=1 Tax=Muraenolepis orangiensis TaxID=630683 RepID=A0A9Q0DPA4_9TELE|nr:hypothetical protein NHX12_009055 [Muraenolepis orangiensis]
MMMSYSMESASSYPPLHPCERLGATQRQGGGGVAAGPLVHFPGVVHPQPPCCPPQPPYAQDVPSQEVPNGRELCPTDTETRAPSLLMEPLKDHCPQHPYVINTPRSQPPSRRPTPGPCAHVEVS